MFHNPASRGYKATLSPAAREFFKNKNLRTRFMCKFYNGDDTIEIDGFKFTRNRPVEQAPPKRGFWSKLFSLRR